MCTRSWFSTALSEFHLLKQYLHSYWPDPISPFFLLGLKIRLLPKFTSYGDVLKSFPKVVAGGNPIDLPPKVFAPLLKVAAIWSASPRAAAIDGTDV